MENEMSFLKPKILNNRPVTDDDLRKYYQLMSGFFGVKK